MSALVNAAEIGTAFFSTPGIPAERLAVLRQAFLRCMEDRDFLAEIVSLKIGLDPLAGERVSEMVSEIGKIPDALVPELQQASLMTQPK
jgi:hypothetical protein